MADLLFINSSLFSLEQLKITRPMKEALKKRDNHLNIKENGTHLPRSNELHALICTSECCSYLRTTIVA